MDLKELQSGVDPRTHWYYQSKQIPLLRFIKLCFQKTGRPLQVIDFGAGSGFFSEELARKIPTLISRVIQVDTGYSTEEVQATIGKKIQKKTELPDKIENSVIIMMDVLEHIEDDKNILNFIRSRCIGNENYFFITVPAFQSLWSEHDVYLGHYRRYTRHTLQKILSPLQFKTYYLYGSIFPLVWLLRRLKKSGEAKSDMAPSPPMINSILKTVTKAEMYVSSCNKLFGVTCVAEGQF